MFGFQRTADSIWAAADQMARGFLIGATAGRTTLTGEGLQHADGHSPILAATNPAVIAYDPAFAFEIGHIMEDGLRRMYGDDPENVIYYITVYNEPMSQPQEPENVDREGILRGMYLFAPGITDGLPDDAPRVQLLASGVGVPWALEAQELLRNDWGVVADVWSVTSWSELRRDGMSCDEQRFLHPNQEARTPYVTQRLRNTRGPVVAVSDYMRQVQDQIRKWVPGDYTTLGTDGFGFSDTRQAARRVFNVDAQSIALAALEALGRTGGVDPSVVARAAARYRVDDVDAAPKSMSSEEQLA
jgi:pyruvate dehydrogenase E1 component